MKFLLFRTSSPILIFLMVNLTLAQENELKVFEPLTGKTWYAEGTWGDGSAFKQEVKFEFSLDSTLVIAKSKGFTNKEQTKFGLRNHGIRQFDQKSKKIRFWEFDVFGGLTQGEILVKDEDFYYTYSYGNSTVTDAWIKQNDHSYKFIVGAYVDQQWKQKYLETVFTVKSK